MNSKVESFDPQNLSNKFIFELCMGEIEYYDTFFDNYFNLVRGNKDKFLDILNDNDNGMGDYYHLFLDYQKAFTLDLIANLKMKSKKDGLRPEKEYAYKVAKMLQMVMLSYSKRNHSLEISISNKSDLISVSNINLTSAIEKALKEELVNILMKETKPTQKEARQEIIKKIDLEWLSKYSKGLFFSEALKAQEKKKGILNNITDFLTSEDGQINLKFVNEVLYEQTSFLKRKPGKEVQNKEIGELAIRLSYIFNFENFINSEQNNCESILDYKLTAKTYRFIYDYLNFWGLIRSSKKTTETNSFLTESFKMKIKRFNEIDDIDEKERRIKNVESIIKHAKNRLQTKGVFHTENKINLLRKVLRGEASIVDYNSMVEKITEPN